MIKPLFLYLAYGLLLTALVNPLRADDGFATAKVSVVEKDPKWAPFEPYLTKLASSVQRQWDRVITVTKVLPPVGGIVDVKFILTADGKVAKISGTSGTTSPRACVKSLTDRSPFGKWPANMVAALGSEQEITLRFSYQ